MYETYQKLLAVAMELSPTGVEQRAFTQLSNSNYENENARMLAIIGAIYDGLAYENWPKPEGEHVNERS